MIHAKDGKYVHGTYDAILRLDEDTFFQFSWTSAAGRVQHVVRGRGLSLLTLQFGGERVGVNQL